MKQEISVLGIDIAKRVFGYPLKAGHLMTSRA
jgi:hypothetical protein